MRRFREAAAHGFKRRRFAWWCCGWRMELGLRSVCVVNWLGFGWSRRKLWRRGSWWHLVNFQRTVTESRDLQVFWVGVRRCGGVSAGGETEKKTFQTLTTVNWETLVGGLYTMVDLEY